MLIEKIAELKVLSSETLMVGDTEFDMEMAKQANAHAMAASYGVHGTDRLKLNQPLTMLQSITELPMWLRDNTQKFDFKC